MENDNGNRTELACGDVVNEIYQGVLGRHADESGFKSHLNALQNGVALSDLIRGMIGSDEFNIRRPAMPGRVFLPDLTKLYPHKYVRFGDDFSVFEASSDEDFELLEALIVKHRFYDSNDVYSPRIDLDKRVTAATIKGLGARSCIELGCFTGPVLSLLAEQGIDVCGVDVSHMAFVLAYNNVREKLRFGDLLDLAFDRVFDVFYGMDVLEHLNPLKLDRYISRIVQLVKQDGFIYINSPMFGTDDVFGTVFDAYFPEWKQVGEGMFWRHIHCDSKGWPVHGHLIFASPKWWEMTFLKHGLVRDRNIERSIQGMLKPFFNTAAARRSLFVLRRSDFNPETENVLKDLSAAISPIVASMEGK